MTFKYRHAHTVFTDIDKLWNRATILQQKHVGCDSPILWLYLLLYCLPLHIQRTREKRRGECVENHRNSQKFCAHLAWLTTQTKYQSLALKVQDQPSFNSAITLWSRLFWRTCHAHQKTTFFWEPLFYGLNTVIKSQKSSIRFRIFYNSKSPSFFTMSIHPVPLIKL